MHNNLQEYGILGGMLDMSDKVENVNVRISFQKE